MFILIISLPEFSIMYGVSCASCHTESQGSGIRNENSWGLQQKYLSFKSRDEVFKYKINEIISYGSDVRIFYLQIADSSYIFPMQTSFYVNYKVNSSVDIVGEIGLRGIYEAYGTIWNLLFLNSYIKAGLFLPNIGLRYEDHTYFTRDYLDNGFIDRYLLRFETGGLELGYADETKLISISVMNSFGNSPLFLSGNQVISSNNYKIYSIGKYNFLIGIGGILKDMENHIFGGYFGFGVLEKTSFIFDYLRFKNFNVFTGTIRYVPVKGFHVVSSYDFSDEKSNMMRFGLGFSFFYNPHIEIMSRYYYYLNQKLNLFLISLHFML
ncbi:MAG: hypothetical protein RMJ38_06550 [candidate division WOR-3 bacterium]|nr:hypothetical protein [candidate division WOR-3 bacterium]MDW8151081.1 hypothetical protein [candidate division WOR-3 bacterium]